MEKLIKDVLDKYNRKKLDNTDLARLILAHIRLGIDGKKGWTLDLNEGHGQNKRAQDIIDEYR